MWRSSARLLLDSVRRPLRGLGQSQDDSAAARLFWSLEEVTGEQESRRLYILL